MKTTKNFKSLSAALDFSDKMKDKGATLKSKSDALKARAAKLAEKLRKMNAQADKLSSASDAARQIARNALNRCSDCEAFLNGPQGEVLKHFMILDAASNTVENHFPAYATGRHGESLYRCESCQDRAAADPARRATAIVARYDAQRAK